MNSLIKIAVVSLLIGITFNIPIYAQQTRQEKQEQRKQQEQYEKLYKIIIKRKKQVGIRDRFKDTKDTFMAIPGTPSVIEQIKNLTILEEKNTPKGHPEYIIISYQAIANSLVVAEMQAQNFFKVNFEGTILTYIISMLEISITKPINNFDEQDTLALRICKNLVHRESQNIQTEIFPVLELYRIRTDNRVEVRMTAACNFNIVNEMYKKAIEEIRKELFSSQDGALEKMLGLDKLIKSDIQPQNEETEE